MLHCNQTAKPTHPCHAVLSGERHQGKRLTARLAVGKRGMAMLRKLWRPGLGGLFMAVSTFSVAAAPESFIGSVEHSRFVGAQQLLGETFHVQGIALAPQRIWITSVDNRSKRGWLHEFDRATGKPLRRMELTDGVRFHPGGLSVSGGALWVPVAEMRARSSAVLVEIDAQTFTVRRRIGVADHIGCLAASGDKLIGGNWDSRLLYVFDKRSGKAERVVANPSQTRFQDMKVVDGQLVASGNVDWLSGTIDWIDMATMQVRRRVKAGAVGPVRPFGRGGPLTGEGMAIEGRDVYLVPEDGPSRVFHYRLEA